MWLTFVGFVLTCFLLPSSGWESDDAQKWLLMEPSVFGSASDPIWEWSPVWVHSSSQE
jgi:hypothetical protein